MYIIVNDNKRLGAADAYFSRQVTGQLDYL
jgi:hypothetical protein